MRKRAWAQYGMSPDNGSPVRGQNAESPDPLG